MKKTLLVSGDSYTDPNWLSEFHPELDTSWPKWPEILAKKLNMNCVNLGKAGAGNEYIYSSLLDYISNPSISNDSIGLVITGWSQIQRKDYQQGQAGRWTNVRNDPHGDAFSLANKSLKFYLSFQYMCEKFNLNYYQIQMINFHSDLLDGLKYGHGEAYKNPSLLKIKMKYQYDKEKDTKRVLKCILSYDKKLNTNKFMGWPIAKELGGFTLCSKGSPIFSKDDEYDEYKVSNLDDHPNAKGQLKIAEYIHDRLG
jgi:hypothetical protein